MLFTGWIYADLSHLIAINYNPYAVYYALKYGKKALFGLLCLVATGVGVKVIHDYMKRNNLSMQDIVNLSKYVRTKERSPVTNV